MNGIDRVFAGGRKALVPYLTAGDPGLDASLEILHAIADGGADIIELGVPFSDPGADGPVLQRAAERALGAGGGLARTLELARRFERDVPLVLFGYLNPFLAYGYERLAAEAAAVGVAGLLCVDCPPEEEPELWAALRTHDVHAIRLIAPTTPEARIAAICADASGFVYYVSRTGVTGAALTERGAAEDRVRRVRELSPVPVVVGFGVRTPDDVAALGEAADGAVVGSALMKLVEEHGAAAGPVVRAYVASLAAPLR